MTFTPRPHDLLWLKSSDALLNIQDAWVASQWHTGLPVVVRRDENDERDIPVGVRGITREQRAAGWVKAKVVSRVVTPEMVADRERLLHSRFVSEQPVQAAILLTTVAWPWHWGITGSTGYAIVTDIPVLHADSDLDLLIRAPQLLTHDELRQWQAQVERLPCRADTQVETPFGAFALNEWLREGRVLLKTVTGPRLTNTPWHRES